VGVVSTQSLRVLMIRAFGPLSRRALEKRSRFNV